MSWGVREWALVTGPDWVIHLGGDAEHSGALLETLDSMLVNSREQIEVYFGPLVMKAGEASAPEAPRSRC